MATQRGGTMPSKKKSSPVEKLEKAIETFKDRNETYGDNYLVHGKVMQALFPNGVDLRTVKEYNRFGIVNMMVAKLTRYCNNWPGAHEDSVHDLGVYSFILESVDDDSV